ncbi:UDP-3-O-(3-hydroxymyristoyl)glucosamine N-acyltransferase [Sphingobacterium olei]|uniref:UDP-3-O-acylglucosamine N-acyltransferase n=1 Tax=Sphingobacterium olei TaxID=2571155 RepID=A0A4U0NZX4_9SPHI|nr:UDP-3-O-(3-hydroxymyristoyl)glucosamine N-acyltransferase [Sphingobacterium olei]TJZ60477.1 UDP-3-O-(3-hydroxymyristoyl)glucosamine N-acyltransferase [Sphingobacterium olei]
MQITAQQIATFLEGKVDGNPDEVVSQLSKIEEGTHGSLSFLSNPKYEHYIYDTDASIVIVNDNLVLQKPVKTTLIRVKNSYTAFTEVLKLYNSLRLERSGRDENIFVHDTAIIGEGGYIGGFSYIDKQVKIGKNVKIYPRVYIGENVTIGDDTTLFPGVTIYYDCVIGKNVIIHSGTVIGSDGFGFAPKEDGTYDKIPQIGNVVIEDNVEVGANTVIDRATLGSTVIHEGAKLDNLIQIAHNVEIGKNTVVAAQTGISGSTKVGEHVVLGGQVGVVGHITIANGSQVQAQSGINKSIKDANKKWGGSPSTPYSSQLRSQVLYSKLPELEKRIAELEKQLKNK